MKQGVSKKEFVERLGEVLSLTREGVESLVLKDKDTVIVVYEGGYEKEVNIAMNSAIAIVRDVAKNI